MTRSFMFCILHHILFGISKKKNEIGGACSLYGGEDRGYRVLVGKCDGKRPLGRHRLRW
jgi:hypothetical protein